MGLLSTNGMRPNQQVLANQRQSRALLVKTHKCSVVALQLGSNGRKVY